MLSRMASATTLALTEQEKFHESFLSAASSALGERSDVVITAKYRLAQYYLRKGKVCACLALRLLCS